MKIGNRNNPFGDLSDECKKEIAEIIKLTTTVGWVPLETTDLSTSRLTVVCYDELLWHVVERHDLIDDTISLEVQFIEGVMTNPTYIEIEPTGKINLVIVEEEEDNGEDDEGELE